MWKNKVPVVVSEKDRLAESDIETIRGEFKETLKRYENELEPRLLAANVELWNRDAFSEINELKKKVMLHLMFIRP